MEHDALEKLLAALSPICFYTEEHAAQFRDKAQLLAILRKTVPSLDDYYNKSAETANIIDRETNLTKVTL